MENNSEILIIGAGPTGLGAAHRLEELGHSQWNLLEAQVQPGGLAASVVDEQGFTWDMGGHVLFSHYEYFDRLMDDLLGDAWVDHLRSAWVWMYDRFIPYPLQNNLRHLPETAVQNCVNGLRKLEAQSAGFTPPANFHEWIDQNFGSGLAEEFMLPYNRKVWAYDPKQMNVEWMGERVARVELTKVLEQIEQKTDHRSWGPNATFRFPLHGGTGAIWKELANRLPKEKLHFGKQVTAVNTSKRKVTTADGSVWNYDRLITSLPLDTLVTLIEDAPDAKAQLAGKFLFSSVHLVGVGMNGQAPEQFKKKCWIYIPGVDVPCYRVTVFSNYSPNNVARPGEQWSLMGEVSESPNKQVNADTIAREVLQGFKNVGFVSEQTEVVSLYHKRLDHGYPTPFLDREKVLKNLQPFLQERGIYSRGRFGGWRYEVSNQDHSLMQGVEAVEHIIECKPEVTYPNPGWVNSRKVKLGERP